QQLPTDAAPAAAAGGACAARARRRPAPPGDRVLLAAPLAARARAGVPSCRRPQRRQTAAAVPAPRNDDDVSDRQLRLHRGHGRRPPLLHAHGRRPQRRHHQTHGGEQRPLRRPRPPLRLPALPVLDPRHPSRHVREQVLAPRAAGHRQDVRERDDRRLRMDPPPSSRSLRGE
ncbi:hypothetical protein ACJX0J_033207, partial [Zea mays]